MTQTPLFFAPSAPFVPFALYLFFTVRTREFELRETRAGRRESELIV